MTIWKTSPLSYSGAILISILLAVPARAGTAFDCLRDILPATELAANRIKRKGWKTPYFHREFLIFPEVTYDRTTAFYVYKGDKAWYYDSVVDAVSPKGRRPIGDLEASSEFDVYELIAQPEGLETLPVIYDPAPAAKRSGDVRKRILRFYTAEEKAGQDLWAPLNKELKLRREWMRSHNLDEAAFKKLNEALKSSCAGIDP